MREGNVLIYLNCYIIIKYTNGFNDFEEAIEFGRAHSLKLCKNNLINRIFKIEKELKNMNTNEEEILKQLEKFKKQLKL